MEEEEEENINNKNSNTCPTPKPHSSSSSYSSSSSSSSSKVTTQMEDEDESKKWESSPLRSPLSCSHCEPKPYSPPRLLPPPDKSQSTAVITMDGRTTHLFPPIRSPPPLQTQTQTQSQSPPESVQVNNLPLSPSPVIVVNRSMREELSGVTKVESGGVHEGGDGDRRPARAVSSVLVRQRREMMVKRAALGFRLCAVVFCLISFSVMAADKTQGWAGDSFDRHKEYRYCLSVAVIGFVYSGFQACDLAYHMVTGKHVIRHHLRPFFDFSIDQILTYLLISASSAAASRVDDWQANWGKDEFTEMASASVGMSFLAFTSFAFSSLISGYNLCTRNYT